MNRILSFKSIGDLIFLKSKDGCHLIMVADDRKSYSSNYAEKLGMIC